MGIEKQNTEPRENEKSENAQNLPENLSGEELLAELGEIKSKYALYNLGEKILGKLFVRDFSENGGKLAGKINFLGNKNFEKWIGLKHLIPAGYAFVKVKSPGGAEIAGECAPNGSFYSNGEYISIWEGYSFESYKKAPLQAAENENPPAKKNLAKEIDPNKEVTGKEYAKNTQIKSPEKLLSLPEVNLSETLFLGDSLTVGMKLTKRIDGAQILAIGGKQTVWMLRQFEDYITKMKNGNAPKVKRIVVRGGINDIASGVDIEKIKLNLGRIYRLARGNGISVVACTHHEWDTSAFLNRFEQRWKRPHKYESKLGSPEKAAAYLSQLTADLNQWILSQTEADVSGVADIDAFVKNETKKGKKMLSSDGLHLSPTGSRITTKFIKQIGRIV